MNNIIADDFPQQINLQLKNYIINGQDNMSVLYKYIVDNRNTINKDKELTQITTLLQQTSLLIKLRRRINKLVTNPELYMRDSGILF